MVMMPSVLLVDDEIQVMDSLERLLDDEFAIYKANSAENALHILESKQINVVISDQRMPGVTGVALLQQIREQYPDVVRIMISGYTEPEDIIKAINDGGIYTYITKPWDPEKLISTVQNATELFLMQHENNRLAQEMKLLPNQLRKNVAQGHQALHEYYNIDEVIVRSSYSPMNDVYDSLHRSASYDFNVLITGETGTEKELCARTIHYNSQRADNPFNTINCSVLSDEKLESELFGLQQEPIANIKADQIGLFEQANGGTIFLDDIDDIGASLQQKLLRVLESKQIFPVGSDKAKDVNVRIISASTKQLETEVRTGSYNEDLYYNLASIQIVLPNLSDRPEDIPLLAKSFLDRSMAQTGKAVKGFTSEALSYLKNYHWPGNVRELENEIKRVLTLCNDDYISETLLSPHILAANPLATLSSPKGSDISLAERMLAIEASIINEALIKYSGDKQLVAEELKMTDQALEHKLAQFKLNEAEYYGQYTAHNEPPTPSAEV